MTHIHLKILQISEAAVASYTQENKIKELEAQLQEAEDIVKDLREELRTVEAELERFSQIKEVKRTVQVDNAPTREPVTFTPSEVQPVSISPVFIFLSKAKSRKHTPTKIIA